MEQRRLSCCSEGKRDLRANLLRAGQAVEVVHALAKVVVHGEDVVGGLADDVGDVGVGIASLKRREEVVSANTGEGCCLREDSRMWKEGMMRITYRTTDLSVALGKLDRANGRGRNTSTQEGEGQAGGVVEDTHCDGGSVWFGGRWWMCVCIERRKGLEVGCANRTELVQVER